MFKPGMLTRGMAQELNELLRDLRSLRRGIRGNNRMTVNSGLGGVDINFRPTARFMARITGSGSLPSGTPGTYAPSTVSYAWNALDPFAQGSYSDRTGGNSGTDGSSATQPAYEVNGNAAVPVGTIVEMWKGWVGSDTTVQNYLFNVLAPAVAARVGAHQLLTMNNGTVVTTFGTGSTVIPWYSHSSIGTNFLLPINDTNLTSHAGTYNALQVQSAGHLFSVSCTLQFTFAAGKFGLVRVLLLLYNVGPNILYEIGSAQIDVPLADDAKNLVITASGITPVSPASSAEIYAAVVNDSSGSINSAVVGTEFDNSYTDPYGSAIMPGLLAAPIAGV